MTRHYLLLLMLAAMLAACASDGDGDADTDTDSDADTDTGPAGFHLIHESPPTAEPGKAYEHVFQAAGGTPPYGNWHHRLPSFARR